MKILVVEDEPKLVRIMTSGLKLQGWTSQNATTAQDAIEFLKYESFDVVLLDRMLEDGSDGMEVCDYMRKHNFESPILFLSAKNEIEDRIGGLNAGADDYLGKPFDMNELYARVRALIRRPASTIGPIYKSGEIQIDLTKKTMKIGPNDIELTKKEFSLIEYLVSNKGLILSKEQIINHVWEYESDILPNTVEATVKNIRNKIKKYSNNEKLISTVRGFGYKLTEQE
ncbi:MAG: response regulator transcription factor [Acidimicrobiia bacterium]